MKLLRKLLTCLLCLVLLASPALAQVLVEDGVALDDQTEALVEYGEDYYLPGEVALYLHAFCELPPNYLTKGEAREWGWVGSKGNLWEVLPGMCIGGDRFGNREGRLPEAKDRHWYECDVNYAGGFRGAERLLFSCDGLIYYSDDHYQTFSLCYEDWYGESAFYIPEQEALQAAG
ncbi:MAG: ribonuclease domain-containing protein [Eubacteriales bacterium]|nr:ribonuclease domain-containing protein [Eubacteriales bacterium]